MVRSMAMTFLALLLLLLPALAYGEQDISADIAKALSAGAAARQHFDDEIKVPFIEEVERQLAETGDYPDEKVRHETAKHCVDVYEDNYIKDVEGQAMGRAKWKGSYVNFNNCDEPPVDPDTGEPAP